MQDLRFYASCVISVETQCLVDRTFSASRHISAKIEMTAWFDPNHPVFRIDDPPL